MGLFFVQNLAIYNTENLSNSIIINGKVVQNVYKYYIYTKIFCQIWSLCINANIRKKSSLQAVWLNYCHIKDFFAGVLV